MIITHKLSDWLRDSSTVLIRGTEPKIALRELSKYLKGPVDFYTEDEDLKRICEYLKLDMSPEPDSIWLQSGDAYRFTEKVKFSGQLWYFQILDGKRPNAKAPSCFDLTIDYVHGEIRGIYYKK